MSLEVVPPHETLSDRIVYETGSTPDEFLKLNLDDAETYYNRGNMKAELKDYKEAILDYDESLKPNPDDYNRGVMKLRLEQYTEAVADFDQAIELISGYAKAYYGRGIAKSYMGRVDDARADLEAALGLAKEQGLDDLSREIEEAVRYLDGYE